MTFLYLLHHLYLFLQSPHPLHDLLSLRFRSSSPYLSLFLLLEFLCSHGAMLTLQGPSALIGEQPLPQIPPGGGVFGMAIDAPGSEQLF
jgi:hypothetical protein